MTNFLLGVFVGASLVLISLLGIAAWRLDKAKRTEAETDPTPAPHWPEQWSRSN